jgi:hypothetical protein
MMSEKWTPGPWRYRPHQYDDWGIVKGADGRTICQAQDLRVSEEEKSECRATGADPYAANAQLIAAAPDLYAALELAKKALTEIRKCSSAGAAVGYTNPEVWGPALYESHGFVHYALDAIDDALAKARGGSND